MNRNSTARAAHELPTCFDQRNRDGFRKASGIDFGVRVHDLRHAHASWLLAGGADLKGVMDRTGHAQIQTTQKYLHTLPDTDQKNLDALTRMTGRSVGDRMS